VNSKFGVYVYAIGSSQQAGGGDSLAGGKGIAVPAQNPAEIAPLVPAGGSMFGLVPYRKQRKTGWA
jgi:hypothetical protein